MGRGRCPEGRVRARKRQWPKKDKLLYWENRSRTWDDSREGLEKNRECVIIAFSPSSILLQHPPRDVILNEYIYVCVYECVYVKHGVIYTYKENKTHLVMIFA